MLAINGYAVAQTKSKFLQKSQDFAQNRDIYTTSSLELFDHIFDCYNSWTRCLQLVLGHKFPLSRNGPYAPFGFESIEKQPWRNKLNDRPIRDSEIKAVLSQLFKTNQWLPPAGHVSEDVTSHA
ncbi:hypothetical protein AVEN_81920-1 [Araneus ventricosus]|uniref:Uncharacterized protein n=1 Tax=Araneus ventricosus TaxID=182803 RepID=A0A4Y2GKQ1_ARAVE|nr:hypothetical protein AVEN_81920-1 [Araneus ventricosus]